MVVDVVSLGLKSPKPGKFYKRIRCLNETDDYENIVRAHMTNPIIQEIKAVLSTYPRIHLAILFGSIATNTARADSDLDLALRAGQPLSTQEKMHLIAALAEELGRPVDLVDLATVGEPLLGEILVHGQRILGDDTVYAQLLNRHVLEQADFVPYQKRILKERRKRWLGM